MSYPRYGRDGTVRPSSPLDVGVGRWRTSRIDPAVMALLKIRSLTISTSALRTHPLTLSEDASRR